MLALVLALAVTPAPLPDARLTVARTVLVKSLDDMDRMITDFERIVDSRPTDADTPRTGITTTSAEDVDTQGLHALTAEIIVKDSPADLAGVRRGDRILRVGNRRIEHETTTVFKLITEGTKGPIPLLLLRNGQELTVTIDRKPIACFQKAAASLNRALWHQLINATRAENADIRKSLDAKDIPEVARYVACKTRVEQQYAGFKKTSELFKKDVELALASCEFAR